MTKLIAFEGISGSGKSYLIKSIISKNKKCEAVKWFDNELSSSLLGNVHNLVPVSHDFFSTCYALDFYGSYKYRIKEKIKDTNLLLHRYIYTPLTHDLVRGSSKEMLNALYEPAKIIEPNMIVYMNTPPNVAYERIIKTRKPSFYECGLDCFMMSDLDQAKSDYNNNNFSNDFLKNCYLEFQCQIVSEYEKLLGNKSNVLWIDYRKDISEYIDYINSYIQN